MSARYSQLRRAHKKNSHFPFQKQSIVHRQSEQCMYNSNSEEVIMRECNSTDPRFQWEFTSTMPKDMLSNKEHAVK